jgi:transposase
MSFNSSYTKRFEEEVYQMCRKGTAQDVSAFVGLGYDAVEGIFMRHGKKKTATRQATPFRVLNIDEIAQEKGHGNFVLVLSAPEKGYVLDVLPDRERKTLEKWLEELPPEVKKAIKKVNLDMWEPYCLAVKAKLRRARRVVDRFHVMKNLNHCLTLARREIQRTASEEVKEQLKGSRWALVKNENDLNDKQRAKLQMVYQVSPELKVCHQLKEQFRTIFETITDRKTARTALQHWIKQVRKQNVTALQSFLVTLDNWLELILNYFVEHWTNAFAEGVNNKIKLIKRRAFGFTNFDHFRLHILVECAPNPT